MGKKNKNLVSPIVTETPPRRRLWLFILLAILAVGNIILLVLYFSPHIHEARDAFVLLNPARKLFQQEDMIINIQGLRDDLNKIGEDQDISIYFEFLNTGANISVNKDMEYFPASLIKLPVAMAAVKNIDEGKWTWDNELVLMRSDKDDKFGNLHEQPIGTKFTIRELIQYSLAESDNTAYRILLRNLEPEELEEVHKHLGLEALFSQEGKINAKKYSILLRSLYNASFLSEESSSQILDIMANSKFKDYLAQGVASDVKFAHKIGISEEDNVVLDAGIVYLPERPYLLTVMIVEEDEAVAMAKMKEISEKAFSYIKNYVEE